MTAWRAIALAGCAALLPHAVPAADNEPDASAFPNILDLEAAQRMALEKNPTLRAAEARARQAQARIRIANSTLWPTIGLGGAGTHAHLSDREVQAIENAAFPFDEDALEGLDRVGREIADEFGNAQLNAVRDVRDARRQDLRNAPDLLAAQEGLFAYRNRLLLEYTDSLRSSLSDFSLSQSITDELGLNRNRTIDDTVDRYRAGVYGTWLLFDGFSRKFTRALARYGQAESDSERRDVRRLLLGAVAGAYFQAQLARAETTIALADLDFNTRLLEEANASNQSGKGSLSTVLNFEVRRNAAESALLLARRELRTGMIGLAALLGAPGGLIPTNTVLGTVDRNPPKDIDLVSADESVAYALQHRPDLEFTRAARDQADANVGLARSDYYPSLSLLGAYGASRPDNMDFDEDDLGGSISLVLSFDVFRGGERFAQVGQAVAIRDEADAALNQVEIDITAEVRESLANLDAARDQFQLQSKNVELVKRTRDLVELEYNAGHASLVRLNEAQRDLVETRSRYATALAALYVAWHELQQTTARSLESFPDD